MKIQVTDAIANQTAVPLNRGELFGDGFFTTGLIEAGKVKYLSAHIERIKLSAKRLQFKALDWPEIKRQLTTIAAEKQQAVFRLNVSRLQHQRGYAINTDHEVNIEFMISPWVSLPLEHFHLELSKTPISVNPLLAGLKHLNRLDNVLAASEIKPPIDEVLLCHGDNIVCGSRSNLFVCINQRWLTPSIENCGIEGISKQRLISKAMSQGIDIKTCEIKRQSVEQWQSAFITNSILGLWPVKQIGNKPLDTEIALQLQSQLSFSR